jgi:spermidine synthase
VFQAFRGPQTKDRVAVIGLGVGTLASYGESGQEFTFFEIDPAVERIARDPRYFTYLSDAEVRGVRVRTVLGDARLALQREPRAHYSLLVVDAFTGDSIPTHLLTGEAVRLYLESLTDDGLIAFHITNGYLDLGPVLGDAAQAAGLVGLIQNDAVLSTEEGRRGKVPSTWVVLARHLATLGPLRAQGRWKPLTGRPSARAWTDNYSNVLGSLRWD